MTSDIGFVEYVCDQMRSAGLIRYRKMFGDYAVYCDDVVVALVCEDRLYVKPTDAGRAFIGDPAEAPPYPGAKLYFAIDEGIDNAEWLGELIAVSVRELPPPKPKRAVVRRTRKG